MTLTYPTRPKLTLLSQHDSMGGKSGPSVPGYRDQLDESLNKVCTLDDLVLFHQLSVNIVEVTGRLQIGEPEATERFERILVSVLLHQPTW